MSEPAILPTPDDDVEEDEADVRAANEALAEWEANCRQAIPFENVMATLGISRADLQR